jgi:hypothetical protein
MLGGREVGKLGSREGRKHERLGRGSAGKPGSNPFYLNYILFPSYDLGAKEPFRYLCTRLEISV